MPRKHETEITRKIDGRTFRAKVPFTVHPEYGELIDRHNLETFEAAIVRHIQTHGLLGPEAFRLCRRFAELGNKELAELLDVNRKTITRWENGEVEIPVAAMAVVAVIAAERSKRRNRMIEQLLNAQHEHPKTVEIELAS